LLSRTLQLSFASDGKLTRKLLESFHEIRIPSFLSRFDLPCNMEILACIKEGEHLNVQCSILSLFKVLIGT